LKFFYCRFSLLFFLYKIDWELLCVLFFQQSSTDIWHAICAAVKSACSLANISGDEVTGMGFAATCSLGL